jgi:hypothetical protein
MDVNEHFHQSFGIRMEIPKLLLLEVRAKLAVPSPRLAIGRKDDPTVDLL